MTFFTSFSKEPSPKKSKGQVMMLSKSKWRRPYFLTFYVKDNQLHLMLPLVFFLGLFEAFMSKTFLTVSALISNFLWTGSSHQTLDKHKKLKFFNVGTCRDKYSSTVFEISVTVMNASVIRFSVSVTKKWWILLESMASWGSFKALFKCCLKLSLVFL